MPSLDVSIIIVNYNTKQLTVNAIKSVIEKTQGLEYEIIVIDNASSDGSVDMLKAEFSDQIEIIESDSNLGFGRANNIGIAKAKGEYVFLLNSDTLLINNAVKILYDYINENPDVGVCGGNLYDLDGNPSVSFAKKFGTVRSYLKGCYAGWIIRLYRLIKFDKTKDKKIRDFNYTSRPMKIAFIIGADMMIRKNVLSESGCFDPDFFMYSEEAELTMRIQKLGYGVISIPQAKIIHINGASSTSYMVNGFNERQFSMRIEGQFKFFQKSYGKSSVKKVYFILISSLWLKKTILGNRRNFNEKYNITRNEYIKWKNGQKSYSIKNMRETKSKL